MFTFNAMCSSVETADKSTHQESQSVDVYGKHRNLVGINKIVACICTTNPNPDLQGSNPIQNLR